MDKELTLALKSLKNKTGIEIDIYSSSFVYLFSSGKKIAFTYVSGVTDGLQDKKQNVTIFSFRFKKESYYGVISGSGEVERNYALFLCGYLENSGIGDDNLNKSDFLKAILLGEMSGNSIVRYIRKFAVPKVDCFVLMIVSECKRIKEIIDFLESFTINGADIAVKLNSDSCAFVKYLTSENDIEYQSPVEFAELICRSLYEEMGIVVHIGVGGTVHNFSECSNSFDQAENAIKLSEIFKSHSCVHSYKEYTLYKMIEDLPPSAVVNYYNNLVDGEAKSILNDSEMLETVEEFMENNLNVSETSRKLYMHRNTLTYRLDKIQRATGLDIRNFSDAVTFRLCNLLHKIINK